MKKSFLLVLIAITAILISCGGSKDSKLNTSEEDSKKEEIKKEDCKLNKDMFASFAQIKYGDKVADVKKIYGTPIEEEKQDEAIMLKYENEDGIPIIFWCNETTLKVETIRLETLGLGENLKTDISDAISEYKLGTCVGSLLGQSRKFVEDNFGKPDSSGKEEFSDYVDYYSTDGNTLLTLKFWKEQNNLMTQININWFYD